MKSRWFLLIVDVGVQVSGQLKSLRVKIGDTFSDISPGIAKHPNKERMLDFTDLTILITQIKDKNKFYDRRK